MDFEDFGHERELFLERFHREAPVFAERYLLHVLELPYVQRWLRRKVGVKDFTPSEALAERRVMVAEMLKGWIRLDARLFRGISEERERVILFSMANATDDSQLFIWKKRICEMVDQMGIPDHVFGKEGWPYPKMWWTFEAPPTISLEGEGDPSMDLQTMLLVQTEEGVSIWSFSTFEDNKVPPGMFETEPACVASQSILKFGEEINTKTLEGRPHLTAAVMKMVSFLNSKYIDHSPQRMCRMDRKLLQHAGMPEEAEQTVRVVDLRAREQLSHKPEEGQGERDWSGRWWVRGHIRAQACGPGRKEHKLIWIAPFIKGPEEKPFIEKVYRVVR